jgi:urease accessory protein
MTSSSLLDRAQSVGPAAVAVSKTGRLTRGRLDLEFTADPDARTYLGRQYAQHPFHVCRVQYHDIDIPGLATLYLQSCSGGLYEDDRLDVRIVACPRSEAHVSTQASTVVHSMPSGCAQQHVRIEAQHRSYLEYLPDPQILFPSSRCSSTMNICVADGATTLVSDSFLQHDPDGANRPFSAYFSEIKVEDDAGKVLAIDRLKLDGWNLKSECPGITGSFAAQGTLVVASVASLPPSMLAELRKIRFDYRDAAVGASMLPKSAGLIIRILAADGEMLKRIMHAYWCAARLALKGTLPAARRK